MPYGNEDWNEALNAVLGIIMREIKDSNNAEVIAKLKEIYNLVVYLKHD